GRPRQPDRREGLGRTVARRPGGGGGQRGPPRHRHARPRPAHHARQTALTNPSSALRFARSPPRETQSRKTTLFSRQISKSSFVTKYCRISLCSIYPRKM